MRLKSHALRLDSALRRPTRYLSLPAVLSRCVACRYSSTQPDSPSNIAVLGGGIAGLSSAYFISREFPKSKITIFEGGKETGGWIRSKRVDVPGGDIIFESGPRTLRNSTATASLVQDLGLIDQVTYVNKTDVAAKNRFIYYPDRLNRLPTEVPKLAHIIELLRSGILAGFASSIIREFFTPGRPRSLDDETVGSFLARRFDKRIVDNLVSAVFHGIYAGDVWKLSAKSLLPVPWHMEGRYGKVLAGFYEINRENEYRYPVRLTHPYDHEVSKALNQEVDLDMRFATRLSDASTFTFKDGMRQLYTSLQTALERKGNVEIKVNSPVQQTIFNKESSKVEVKSGNEDSPQSSTYDLVINSLRQPDLTPYVTVMTVNLYYNNPNLLPEQGFGYLIPQSVPFDQNPERALGVIFDSYAATDQDSAPGTKLTIMMGGHWWDGWSVYPESTEGLEMAKSIVQRHLGITDEPTAHFVNLAKDCIPQYTLGYEDRLFDFAERMSSEYKGQMRFVGNQFNGVGVNDVITSAWNLARLLRNGGWKSSSCGLDRVARRSESWRPVDVRELSYRKVVDETAFSEE